MYGLLIFFGEGWDRVHFVRRPLFDRHIVSAPMTDEYEAFGVMRIGKGSRSTQRKRALHYESYMAWLGIQPGTAPER
jgi:hypothetical protein